MGDEILHILKDDELRKTFEPILDYLKASMAIRTNNKESSYDQSNKENRNLTPLFVYPWSYSQIQLNSPQSKPEDIELFGQNFAKYVQIHVERRNYTYTSTKGNNTPCATYEKWIEAPEEGQFVQFLKEWKIPNPLSLDVPTELTIFDAFRWFCILQLYDNPFLDFQTFSKTIDPHNLLPNLLKKFSGTLFPDDYIYGLHPKSFNSHFSEFPFIKFIGGGCWRKPPFSTTMETGEFFMRDIRALLIDPELKPLITIRPEITAQTLSIAIRNKFSEFAVNNPEIVKNGALTYLEDQLKISDTRPGKIGSLKEINPLYIEYMQKEGWISPLPGNQFKLTSKMVRASVPNQIGNSNNNIAPILDDWWAQVIKLKQETKNVPPEQSKDSLIKDKGVGLENKFVVYAGIKHNCAMKDNLLQLEIKEAGISDIKAIEGLSRLTELGALCLSENKIAEIRGLETLTNLRHLHLRSNQITKISGLEKLINLTTIHLSENNITEIRGLETLTNLRHLHLRSNQITKISGLEKLTHLTELYLNHNSITKVSGLDNLTELTKIDLSHNKIKNLNDVLPGIRNLPCLSSLDLENNSPLLTNQIEEHVISKKIEDISKVLLIVAGKSDNFEKTGDEPESSVINLQTEPYGYFYPSCRGDPHHRPR